MADAMETARQIVKTSDDCLCEGADMATLVSRIEAHVSAYAAQVLAEAKAADAMGHKRCVKCGEAIPLTEVALWDLSGDEQHRHMHCLPADLRDAIGPIKKDEP